MAHFNAKSVKSTEDLSHAVLAAGWHFLSSSDAPLLRALRAHDPAYGHIIVIGTFTWSNVDLMFLQTLSQNPSLTQNAQVCVFDFDQTYDGEDLKNYLMNFPLPTTTPYVVEHRDGEFVRLLQGNAAWHWVKLTL